MKTCSKCGLSKLESEFNKSSKRGLQHYCRKCANSSSRKWYDLNTEQARASSEEWAKRNPLRHKASRKNWNLLKSYGLSLAEFELLLATQEGLCACCKRVMTCPHVDHDHKTGKIRSLLCGTCNTGIGQFGEDPERCELAAAYLRKHKL